MNAPRSSLLATPLVLVLLLGLPATGRADVLTTTDGLSIEGEVQRLEDGRYRVRTAAGDVELEARSVASVRKGEGPRAAFARAAAGVKADDAVGLYRLALQAEEAGLADLARQTYERILVIDAEHPAARRALGYEKSDGRWVSTEQARRAQGLVLYRGAWMLPAEVEAAAGKAAALTPAAGTPKAAAATDEDRVAALIRRLAHGPDALRLAARLALARTADALILAGALRMLYDADAAVRIASCRVLAELGDEAALRPLILSGARDKDGAVRREAVLAAQSLGHDDTAVPYCRALFSENLRLAGNAAEALALLGDERTAGYIVRRLESHGSSTRNVVSFLNQISYVRDYDVEIAQASNIANPDVATLMEGVILDVRVLDAHYTRTWIEPLLVKAYADVVDQPLRTRDEVRGWHAEHGAALPAFPEKPKQRAPRRRPRGKVVGAQ